MNWKHDLRRVSIHACKRDTIQDGVRLYGLSKVPRPVQYCIKTSSRLYRYPPRLGVRAQMCAPEPLTSLVMRAAAQGHLYCLHFDRGASPLTRSQQTEHGPSQRPPGNYRSRSALDSPPQSTCPEIFSSSVSCRPGRFRSTPTASAAAIVGIIRVVVAVRIDRRVSAALLGGKLSRRAHSTVSASQEGRQQLDPVCVWQREEVEEVQ